MRDLRREHEIREGVPGSPLLPPWDPNGGGLVCKRVGGTPHVNVPITVWHHSPDGPEWGYHGSGPADLALNLCHQVWPVDPESLWTIECWKGRVSYLAWTVHQRLKREFIARLPERGGIVSGYQLRLWMLQDACRVASKDEEPHFVLQGLRACFKLEKVEERHTYSCYWCPRTVSLDWDKSDPQISDAACMLAAHPFECSGQIVLGR